MEEVNARMIILARESRGWGQKELGEKIQMSPANLSKIEREDIGISPETLEEMAQATDYPVQFFCQGGGTVSENLAYRKRRNVPQKFITTIDARANVFRRHVQFLTRILNAKPADLP